jgi:hypothetical protein
MGGSVISVSLASSIASLKMTSSIRSLSWGRQPVCVVPFLLVTVSPVAAVFCR